MLDSLDKYRDFGLLVLRIGIGAMFVMHGYPQLTGGPEMWEKIGMAMSNFGIHQHDYQKIFGFLAAASEGLGGLCLILGFFFRPACFFMLCTMIVASAHHLTAGDGLNVASHAIEMAFVFFGLIFVGPGAIRIRAKGKRSSR